MGGVGEALTDVLDDGLHGGVDLVELVDGVEVGHVTRVEDVVDVLEERLGLDLRV